MTTDPTQMLEGIYRFFNERDIDGVLAHLAPGVDWPNAATGGRVIGREAVRAYWTAQWQQANPIVEPVRITLDGAGRAHVEVDQLIQSLDGKVLDHRHVEHVYEFTGPFISRMTIVPMAGQPDEDED